MTDPNDLELLVVACTGQATASVREAVEALAAERSIRLVTPEEIVDAPIEASAEVARSLERDLLLGEAFSFDTEWHAGWSRHRQWCQDLADQLAAFAPADTPVLLADSSLVLVAPRLRDLRADLPIVVTTLDPFPAPDALAALPDLPRDEILLAMLGAKRCGFGSPRWRDTFDESCRRFLGVRAQHTFVSPLGTIPADLAEDADSEAAALLLRAEIDERTLIAVVDELTAGANIARSIWAVDELLAARPDLIDQIVLGIEASSTTNAEHERLLADAQSAAESVNLRWGRDAWVPIHLRLDDQEHGQALLRRADIVLVNPASTASNHRVSNGALLNERDGIVVMSPTAADHDDLGGVAIASHPFDLTATAHALETAIDLEVTDRLTRSADWRDIVASRTVRHWLDDQLDAAAP